MKLYGWAIFTILISAAPCVLHGSGAVEYMLYRTTENSAALPVTDPRLLTGGAITLPQAAKDMSDALAMQNIPTSFEHILHHLLARLQQLSQRKNAVWSQESLELYLQLARFQKLFAMLENNQFSSPALLLGINRANVLPESDCMVLNNTVKAPVWQAFRGRKFHAAVVVLSRRAKLDAELSASPIAAAAGGGTIKTRLQKVQYLLKNGSWQHQLLPDRFIGRVEGLEIFLLSADVGKMLAPGLYNGSMTLAGADGSTSKLEYTIELN